MKWKGTLGMVRNERGITLVELLAVFVIGAIISVLASATLFGGFKTHERVLAEGKLRDEADLIMAVLIQDLYVVKLSEITGHEFNKSDGTYLIKLNDGQQIGFIDGTVKRSNGETIKLQSGVHIVSGTEIKEIDTGQYEITLVLEDESTSQKLKTTSEIGLIKYGG